MQHFQTSLFYDLQELVGNSSLLPMLKAQHQSGQKDDTSDTSDTSAPSATG